MSPPLTPVPNSDPAPAAAPAPTPDPTPNTAASALRSRTIPQMLLSTGSSTSLTAAPAVSKDVGAAERARKRFEVGGVGVVTGGAGTLALINARALLEHGLSGLALFDLNLSHASAQINELRSDFPNVQVLEVAVDVSDAAAVQQAVDLTVRELGSVDILCCFAGVVGCTHATEMTPEGWRKMLDINTTGAFLCAQAVTKRMIIQRRGGSILLVASISAHRTNFPQPQAAYNASKAALISLKGSLAAEWSRYGIRVNSISPGYMNTILNEGDGLEEARRIWVKRNPMGRMGEPEELTGAVVLLCGGAGSYINGADIVLDGGQLCF